MEDPNKISYIRVDILENWRFWNRFRNDLEGAGKEVIAEADALLALDENIENERVKMLINESRSFRIKKQKAGQQGGKRKKANRDSGHEQRPAVTEAGSGNAPVGLMDAFYSSVTATSDGAAGPRGGTPEYPSPREGVLEPLPPQQPHAGKPRRPSPDMLRGYTIPEMGDVWDFVHENRIPESVASEWYAWNEEMKWPPLKKGWKAALRGFAKKKEEE